MRHDSGYTFQTAPEGHEVEGGERWGVFVVVRCFGVFVAMKRWVFQLRWCAYIALDKSAGVARCGLRTIAQTPLYCRPDWYLVSVCVQRELQENTT